MKQRRSSRAGVLRRVVNLSGRRRHFPRGFHKRSNPTYYVGVDLHKERISICLVRLEGRKRIVVVRRRFPCSQVEGICQFLRQYVPFQVVVGAAASYDWFVGLVERGADRVVLAHPKKLRVFAADRFVLGELLQEWQQHQKRLKEADRQLATFAKTAPAAEQEARKVLETIPSVGPVTIDVVLSEVADAGRFRSLKRAGSFSGLAPGARESAGRAKEQHITRRARDCCGGR
jgi:hypothetical protein